MKAKPPHENLSRRERQIMEVLYRCGRASVGEVMQELPDPPTYSAVRAMLRILEEKGQIKHLEEGKKFVYLPSVPRGKASRFALRNVLQTFFNGSVEQVVASLIDLEKEKLSEEELDRLSRLIENARQEGR
jgi:predicted transcriptional regulator